MKAIKMIGCICASLLVCAGILLYSMVRSTETIVVDNIVNEVVNQITQSAIANSSDLFKDVLPENVQEQISQGVMENLPSEVQDKMDEVKEEISKDAQINALSQKYMDALLAGAIDGTSELPDVSADVRNVIEEKLPEVAEITGKDINSEEVANLADEIMQKTNLQEKLESIVERVHESMTPSQKQVLSMIRMIQNGNMQLVAYGLIGFGLFAIALLTLSPIKWMIYGGIASLLSGGCLLAGSKVIQMFVGNKLHQLGEVFQTVGDSFFASLFSNGILFAGIGIGLLLVYALISFVKNHFVYE